MCADADDAALVEVLGGVLAYIRDIACEFLDAALGLAHLESIFIDVHRSEDVFLHHSFVEHDGVLIVVAFPGHECHLKVAAQSEFAVFGGISFGEDVAFLHAVALIADGAQVDGGSLVGATEFGQLVFFESRLERDKFLVGCAVVVDADYSRVDKLDCAVAFGHYLRAGVADELTLDACAHNRGLAAEQRHGLAHHVGAHQRAVGIVVLQEGNE